MNTGAFSIFVKVNPQIQPLHGSLFDRNLLRKALEEGTHIMRKTVVAAAPIGNPEKTELGGGDKGSGYLKASILAFVAPKKGDEEKENLNVPLTGVVEIAPKSDAGYMAIYPSMDRFMDSPWYGNVLAHGPSVARFRKIEAMLSKRDQNGMLLSFSHSYNAKTGRALAVNAARNLRKGKNATAFKVYAQFLAQTATGNMAGLGYTGKSKLNPYFKTALSIGTSFVEGKISEIMQKGIAEFAADNNARKE